MPSPVGHMLGGAAVYLAAKTKENRSNSGLTVTLLGSILPDFDFLPGILIGEPAAFHHGISHSFAFAGLYGVLSFFVIRPFHPKKTLRKAAVLGAIAYASHVLLDMMSIPADAKRIPILWPLSNATFGTNVNLFGHFHHGGLEEGIWNVVRWHNLPAIVRELVLLGAPVLLLFFWRGRARASNFTGQKAHEGEYER